MSLAQRNTQTSDESTFVPIAVESLVTQSKALDSIAANLGASSIKRFA